MASVAYNDHDDTKEHHGTSLNRIYEIKTFSLKKAEIMKRKRRWGKERDRNIIS